jgi:heat induced stress protein YflT
MVMTENTRRVPSPPSEVVASFTTWQDTLRAVEFLAERRLPLAHTAVVTRELRLVGRGTLAAYGHAILDRAVSGAVGGALAGFVLGLLSSTTLATSAPVLALAGVTIGTAGGSLAALCEQVVSRHARSVIATRRLEARRYDLVVMAPMAEHARRLLDELVTRGRS